MSNPRAPLRVLIVDDSPIDYELLTLGLRSAGFAVDAGRVETKEQLRAALSDRRWDIVLVDWFLPSLTAAEAIEATEGLVPDLPCIVVTGLDPAARDTLAKIALHMGAQGFFGKDQLEALAVHLRELLYGR